MSSNAMNSPLTSHEVYQQVCREHQALGGKITRIRQVCGGGIISGEEIAAMLLDLYDTLREHFANEEFHGFFGEVTSHAPALTHDANKLCAEHREMLHTATELTRFALAGAASHEWWRELNTRFLVFADQLQRHEHEESALLQRAYLEDVGVND